MKLKSATSIEERISRVLLLYCFSVIF